MLRLTDDHSRRKSFAALFSFVRSWTAELARHGIQANVISPGPTEMSMIHVGSKGFPEGTSEYFRKMIPMARPLILFDFVQWHFAGAFFPLRPSRFFAAYYS
jgi:NAD(P)-dependent dehydrogenase (short-subunit alcohol dehydrogenase family)